MSCWTHLTKVVVKYPSVFFNFSYLFLKVCSLFFLFGIAVLAGIWAAVPSSWTVQASFRPKAVSTAGFKDDCENKKMLLFSLQGTVDYKVAFSELLDSKIASSWKNKGRGLAGFDHPIKNKSDFRKSTLIGKACSSSWFWFPSLSVTGT